MPSIDLVGDDGFGLSVEIPQAPLKLGQVLIGGFEEGLRALTEAGIVRHTGEYYKSKEYDATFPICDLLVDWSREPGQNENSKTAQKNRELVGEFTIGWFSARVHKIEPKNFEIEMTGRMNEVTNAWRYVDTPDGNSYTLIVPKSAAKHVAVFASKVNELVKFLAQGMSPEQCEEQFLRRARIGGSEITMLRQEQERDHELDFTR
jgi:hypothetical protein